MALERFNVQAPSAIASVAWSSDGRLATGSPDAVARVWDGFAGDGAPRAEWPHQPDLLRRVGPR